MLSLEMLGYCDNKPDSQGYPAKLEYFLSKSRFLSP